MKNKSTMLAVLFILLQSVIYGYGDPISKEAYECISVYSLLTIRYWIAFGFLMLLFGKRVICQVKACAWWRLLLPSICIAASFIISNIAINMTSPTAVAFLKSTATIMTPLLALVAFRKKYSPKHIPILALLLVGLYLLCNPGEDLALGQGELLSLLSALLAAGSLVFAEDALNQVDALTITTIQSAASALLVTICAFVFEGGIQADGVNSFVAMTILYMALACTVGGYLLQNYALNTISASTVAIMQCTYPVMTAIFSYFILAERLSLEAIAGVVIILVCVIAENLIE